MYHVVNHLTPLILQLVVQPYIANNTSVLSLAKMSQVSEALETPETTETKYRCSLEEVRICPKKVMDSPSVTKFLGPETGYSQKYRPGRSNLLRDPDS